MSTLTKKELIDAVAEASGESKTNTAKIIDSMTSEIQSALSGRKSVTLVGFGTFTTQQSPARKGRNPSTGKEIDIPASTKCKFRQGKALKEAVNG